ncbi:MAG: DUF7467 domain-containing protein [bacterium]
MKNAFLLVLFLVGFLVSCETETISNTDPVFVYNTNTQYLTTESFTIDFEQFTAGDIVSEIMITDPFEDAQVAGITMAFPNSNAAMIFDSSNPTGNDFDLGTPNEQYGGPGIGSGGASNDIALGNVLILSEDLDSTDPDDIFEIGALFRFDFSANENVTLQSFDILDIEASSNPTVVTLYDSNDMILLSKEVSPGGDNSKAKVDLESTENVAFLEIVMNSSGAIDNLMLDISIEEPCVDCDSPITSLSFRYNGALDDAPIRVETLDGSILFEGNVALNDTFTVFGNETDGTFSSAIMLYVNNEAIASLATDCSQIIGPGLLLDGLEVIAGTTLSGGQLCPVETAF